jgi:SAM-dependent methyltransferase
MSSNYYAGINNHLLNQVPSNAKKIFEIGCGHGNFGEIVKLHNPSVTYYAMEIVPEAAKIAASKLDHVFCGSIESSSLVDDQFDCIIFGDVLEHLYNPLEVLRKIRPMLKPDGCVLCSVPNIQHHSILASLLAGDFQYQDMGLLDRTHIRFFTYASFIKLLLDAGFAPQIVDVVGSPPPPEFFEALRSGLGYLKQDAELSRYYMSAFQYIFKGSINLDYVVEELPAFPISFIVPTNDRRVLYENFVSSPVFKGQNPHQLIMLEHQTSAAQALESGVSLAEHNFVVYVHQDVYLPHKWDSIFCRKVIEAQATFCNAEMFGVYGVRWNNGEVIKHGHVMDRHWSLKHDNKLPAEVDSVDELLIGFRKDGFPGTDSSLGYHLYGTDIACRYREIGKSAVILNAPCFHNSGLGVNLPPEFYAGIPALKAKWSKYLPLATSCGTISS